MSAMLRSPGEVQMHLLVLALHPLYRRAVYADAVLRQRAQKFPSRLCAEGAAAVGTDTSRTACFLVKAVNHSFACTYIGTHLGLGFKQTVNGRKFVPEYPTPVFKTRADPLRMEVKLEVMPAHDQINRLSAELCRWIVAPSRYQGLPLALKAQILLHLEKHRERHAEFLANPGHPLRWLNDVTARVAAAIGFAVASQAPSDALRHVALVVDDGDGANTAPATVEILVAPVDDPPRIRHAVALTVPGIAVPLDIAIDDPEGTAVTWELLGSLPAEAGNIATPPGADRLWFTPAGPGAWSIPLRARDATGSSVDGALACAVTAATAATRPLIASDAPPIAVLGDVWTYALRLDSGAVVRDAAGNADCVLRWSMDGAAMTTVPMEGLGATLTWNAAGFAGRHVVCRVLVTDRSGRSAAVQQALVLVRANLGVDQ